MYGFKLWCTVSRFDQWSNRKLSIDYNCGNFSMPTAAVCWHSAFTLHRARFARSTCRHMSLCKQLRLPRESCGNWVLVVTTDEYAWHFNWHEKFKSDFNSQTEEQEWQLAEGIRGHWSRGRNAGATFCGETRQSLPIGSTNDGQLCWADCGRSRQYSDAWLRIFCWHNGMWNKPAWEMGIKRMEFSVALISCSLSTPTVRILARHWSRSEVWSIDEIGCQWH